MSSNETVSQQEHFKLTGISDSDNAFVFKALVQEDLFFGDWESLSINSELHAEFGITRQ